jgi:hypothetical protein
MRLAAIGDSSTTFNLNEMGAAAVAIGYKGAPADGTNTSIFLASDLSSYISDIYHIADGSLTLP